MSNKFHDEYGKEIEDALNEQNLISEFNEEIKNTDFHVYGLSGDWGTGKTSFIKMWQNNINKDDTFIIVIDAFEKDYIQNPFLMIYDAFRTFMKENKISDNDAKPIVCKAKKIAFASMKAAGQFGINFLIEKIGEENVKALTSAVSDTLFDQFDYNPKEKEDDICKELKEDLTKIVKNSKKKLYIVIDELDRCRPDFALETLEKVKHLFAIDGVKFFLVYNPEIISAIVKNKYGIDDNNRYIKKFVEKEILFEPTKFYSNWLKNESQILSSKGVNPYICRYISGWSESISKVMVMYDLSLRDTQRILTQIDNRNYFSDIDFNVIFGATIEFFKAINKNEYDGMIDYLQKNNGSFASNAPVRTNYKKIASLLMKYNDDIDVEAKFMEYFKNKKQYGNI